MKKIIFILIWLLSNFQTFASIEDDIKPTNWNNEAINVYDWKESVFSLFTYIKDSIFWLLALIAIAVFLFIWARLVIARWNPEEFKKALMQFIYAIVWLFIVAFAWAAVKIISNLNL